jgi:hypothetical protein
VSTLQIHGTGDQTIRYRGGENSGQKYPGAVETLEAWAASNGCDLTADDPPPEPRDIIQDAEPATVTAYSDGCRGNGCYVCAELVTNYPKYFEHHPGCVKNGTCMGVFATCNENCPAPVAADM